MSSHRRALLLPLVCLLLALPSAAFPAELMITQATDLTFDYDPQSDSLITSVVGRLWRVPANGGEAKALTPTGLQLHQPAVSPNGRYVVAEGGWHRGERHLWLIDQTSEEIRQLTDGSWQDHSASWHPDSGRLLFVSNRSGTQDIWALSISDLMAQHITRDRGDETDPVYIGNGRGIAYVSRTAKQYSLLQQTEIGRAITLYASAHRLSAPSLRKDGVVLTFFSHQPSGGSTLQALLPVQEMLVKPIRTFRANETHKLIWRDRDHYYAADRGRIKLRKFATTWEQSIPFTAWMSIDEPASNQASAQATALETAHTPFVVRAARLFNVETGVHQLRQDILVADGRIAEIQPQRTWGDMLVIDLGDVTVLPGLIDLDADVSSNKDAEWLAAGITSIASLRGAPSSAKDAEYQVSRWQVPLVDIRDVADNRERLDILANRAGRRFLTDQLLPDLTAGAALLDSAWLAKAGISSYEDHQLLINRSDTRVSSHLVSRGILPRTLVPALMQHRLWPSGNGLAQTPAVVDNTAVSYGHLMVAASGRSPLPAGLSLIAELLTMNHYGIGMPDVIASATSRAADLLSQEDIGVIAVGKRADLLIIDGDPLVDPQALLRSVAIIKGGQLLSISRLLDE